MSNQNQRNTGLDVIRCIALFSVIAVHFFLNTGFYGEIVEGYRMQIFIYLRSALMISIPLFLMSSGYLLHDRTLSARYYLRIIRILFMYVCASILYGLYRVYILKDGLTLLDAFLGIFSFSTLSYSWYIEMYCGLFLMIPFLNVLYNGLDGQKQKQWLVLTFLILTAAPSMINIYRFDSWTWWLLPSTNSEYHTLIPDWWTGIYPITYYFIGCYLSEHPLKIKRSSNILLIISIICISGTFNWFRSLGSTFIWGHWQDWRSGFNLVISVLIFTLFSQLDYQGMGVISRKFVSQVADLSLGAYLLSGLFDGWFYVILNTHIPNVQDRLPYMPVAVSVVLFLSLVGAHLLRSLYRDTAEKLVAKLEHKVSV